MSLCLYLRAEDTLPQESPKNAGILRLPKTCQRVLQVLAMSLDHPLDCFLSAYLHIVFGKDRAASQDRSTLARGRERHPVARDVGESARQKLLGRTPNEVQEC